MRIVYCLNSSKSTILFNKTTVFVIIWLQ